MLKNIKYICLLSSAAIVLRSDAMEIHVKEVDGPGCKDPPAVGYDCSEVEFKPGPIYFLTRSYRNSSSVPHLRIPHLDISIPFKFVPRDGTWHSSLGIHYEDPWTGNAATISLSKHSNNVDILVHGHFLLSETPWQLEPCVKFDDCHILVRTIYPFTRDATFPDMDKSSFQTVTISASVWYTDELEKHVKSIEALIIKEMHVLNVGFKNTKIPLKMQLHCLRKSAWDEKAEPGNALDAHFIYDGPYERILGTADVAFLYAYNGEDKFCGRSFTVGAHVYKFGKYRLPPVFAASYLCRSINILGHELGHTLGISHDRAKDNSNPWGYGHGYVSPENFKTITANSLAEGVAINYYSNTFIKLKGQYRMGDEQNNAYRVIMAVKKIASEFGDESDRRCLESGEIDMI